MPNQRIKLKLKVGKELKTKPKTEPKPKPNTKPKTKPKNRPAKIGLLVAAVVIVVGATLGPQMLAQVKALGCPGVEVLWARGSGSETQNDDYQGLKAELDTRLAGVSWHLQEVDYPAVDASGLTALGALVSGGQSYKFGRSVDAGVNYVKNRVASISLSCPDTKFVLVGYSQGALVMIKSLQWLTTDKVIYVATLGDPKLYLPEGAGVKPRACTDATSYSAYRTFVPDCYAYEGILGGNRPYIESEWSGRVGVWCNYNDIMCSSKINLSDLFGAHTSYLSSGRIADVAEVIGYRVRASLLGMEPTATKGSGHDVVILMDSTGSMIGDEVQFKQKAARLAKDTIAAGGRVALYEYKDLVNKDKYGNNYNFEARQLCDFGTPLSEITDKIWAIKNEGGNNTLPESLLAASMVVMNGLRWQSGANKEIVVFTDAGFYSPDKDGTTLSQVTQRALEIDPVHFYMVVNNEYTIDEFPELDELAALTNGGVYTLDGADDLISMLVEKPNEGIVFDDMRSEIESSVSIQKISETHSGDEVEIEFETDGALTMVIINEMVYGFTDWMTLKISELDLSVPNEITLVPYSLQGVRGEKNGIVVGGAGDSGEDAGGDTETTPLTLEIRVFPKAPNSGVAIVDKRRHY